MRGPLDGIRVLDFTRLLPGPLAALCLADLGAEVIKLEGVPHGDYSRRMGADDENSSISFVALNQNKASVQIDHRTPDGLAAVHDLVKTVDVFIESARPGSLVAHRLDAATLRDLNPRLVYCSVSAYGSFGEMGGWPGHGYNIEAHAGLISATEQPDGSYRLPEYSMLIASLATGHQAATAIAASLVGALRTGRGAALEVAAFDAGVTFDPLDGAHSLNGVPHDATIGTPATPKYAAYRTADGLPILLATIEGPAWTRFCRLVGREDLIPEHHHDEGSDWGHDHPHLYAVLSEIFAGRSLREWMDLVRAHPLPLSPIRTPAEVVGTRHFEDRGLTRDTVGPSGRTVRTLRPPTLFDNERLGGTGRWSEPGEDTVEVLERAGFAPERIDGLLASGTARQR